jgi:hypothetical protein
LKSCPNSLKTSLASAPAPTHRILQLPQPSPTVSRAQARKQKRGISIPKFPILLPNYRSTNHLHRRTPTATPELPRKIRNSNYFSFLLLSQRQGAGE